MKNSCKLNRDHPKYQAADLFTSYRGSDNIHSTISIRLLYPVQKYQHWEKMDTDVQKGTYLQYKSKSNNKFLLL